MISENKKSPLSRKPVFLVSQSKQDEVCKEIYDYLTHQKLKQLKEAILNFNKVIRQIIG